MVLKKLFKNIDTKRPRRSAPKMFCILITCVTVVYALRICLPHSRRLQRVIGKSDSVWKTSDMLPGKCRSQSCALFEAQVNEVVVNLRSKQRPFTILESYWSPEKAKIMAGETKRAVSECRSEFGASGLDHRRLGTNEHRFKFPLSHELATDPFLSAVAVKYLNISAGHGSHALRVKTQAGVTYPGGSSGGGWHIDSKRGLKALMYLSDVSEGTGPFQMLLGYTPDIQHKRDDPKGRNTRYSDAEVLSQIYSRGARVHTFIAQAGTVILFDVSKIHRGALCQELGRITNTLYYETSLPSTFCEVGANGKPVFERIDQ